MPAVLTFALDTRTALILSAMAPSLSRLAIGPRLVDPSGALETTAVAAVALFGLEAIRCDEPALLDVATVPPLPSLRATVALAHLAACTRASVNKQTS